MMAFGYRGSIDRFAVTNNALVDTCVHFTLDRLSAEAEFGGHERPTNPSALLLLVHASTGRINVTQLSPTTT